MSIISALTELADKRKAVEEASRNEARKILTPGLRDFMEAHPEIEAIRWRQFTPYFNDGDACEFGVGELTYKLVGGDVYDDEGDYEDGFLSISTYGKPKDWVTPDWFLALGELERALMGSESELEAAFGDHVKVTVTRDGVDVDEYDHD
jgi:hypothetical protein